MCIHLPVQLRNKRTKKEIEMKGEKGIFGTLVLLDSKSAIV